MTTLRGTRLAGANVEYHLPRIYRTHRRSYRSLHQKSILLHVIHIKVTTFFLKEKAVYKMDNNARNAQFVTL